LLKEIIIALRAYRKAHLFIKANKLWKWIIIPGIIYTALFLIGAIYFTDTSSDAISWMALKTGLKGWLDKTDNGLLGFVFTMGGLILWLILMLFYFSLFKYLFLIIGSPVFAYLSEKTVAIIEGKDFPFSFPKIIHDAYRGIKLAVRNSLWQTVYLISIILLNLIPVVGWLTPILAILIECYYYGFSMIDYTMERHNKTSSQSIHFINTHKGLAIGNGLVFYLMHLVPIIGWVLAPSYAVVAATLSVYPLKEQHTANNE
jgi:CysZ protein